MNINPYSIPPLLCAIYALFLGIIVFKKNPKSGAHQSFSLLCLATVVWLSFYSINFTLSYSHPNYSVIDIIYRIAYCGIAFIAVAFFHHTIEFLGIKWAKAWNIGNYIYGFILSLLILRTNLIVNGVKEFFWGFYPQAGPLHPYFLTYFLALLLISFSLFLKKFFSADMGSTEKNQFKYLFLALFIFGFASFDFVPNYGISWYPWGYIPTTLFLSIVTYAIIKHRLMDINIVFKTSIVYSILITSVSIVYLVIVLTAEKALQSLLGYKSMSVSLSAAFMIGILVIPLRNRIQVLLDRSLFKGTQPEIAAENELLRREVTQSEKHKAVAALASGIAHEVRNPLTALKTFYEHFPEKKNDPEFIAKFTQIAGKEIGRIEGLIQQLLDFAKPSPPSFRETDVNRLIE
ncbi:MAG: histidine kinase N-terminal 7TM domain-containing protein, partial [Nitrospirota bacterium]